MSEVLEKLLKRYTAYRIAKLIGVEPKTVYDWVKKMEHGDGAGYKPSQASLEKLMALEAQGERSE